MPKSNLCEISLPNGRDCPGEVPRDAPVAACWEHMKVIAEFVADRRGEPSGLEREKIPLPCPECDYLTLWRVVGTEECRCRCGYVGQFGEIRGALERAMAIRLQPKRPDDRTSVVYFIRFGDRVKIGTTTNRRQRLASLPYDEVLAVTPGDVSHERALHARFRHLRVTGEWFQDDPEIRQFVALLKRNGKLIKAS